MDTINKLTNKMDKRIGMKVTTKDDMKVHTITGVNVKPGEDNDFEVKYLLCSENVYGEPVLRTVNEANIVLMKEPNY